MKIDKSQWKKAANRFVLGTVSRERLLLREFCASNVFLQLDVNVDNSLIVAAFAEYIRNKGEVSLFNETFFGGKRGTAAVLLALGVSCSSFTARVPDPSSSSVSSIHTGASQEHYEEEEARKSRALVPDIAQSMREVWVEIERLAEKHMIADRARKVFSEGTFNRVSKLGDIAFSEQKRAEATVYAAATGNEQKLRGGQVLEAVKKSLSLKFLAPPSAASHSGNSQSRLASGDLLKYINDHPGSLTLSEVTELVAQIVLGVRELHRHGLVHRDLKPANILIFPSPSGKSLPRLGLADLDEVCQADSALDYVDNGSPKSGRHVRLVGTPLYFPKTDRELFHTCQVIPSRLKNPKLFYGQRLPENFPNDTVYVRVDNSGRLFVKFFAESEIQIGQVSLKSFPDKEGLIRSQCPLGKALLAKYQYSSEYIGKEADAFIAAQEAYNQLMERFKRADPSRLDLFALGQIIQDLLHLLPQNVDASSLKSLRDMLADENGKTLTIEDVMQHELFVGIDFKALPEKYPDGATVVLGGDYSTPVLPKPGDLFAMLPPPLKDLKFIFDSLENKLTALEKGDGVDKLSLQALQRQAIQFFIKLCCIQVDSDLADYQPLLIQLREQMLLRLRPHFEKGQSELFKPIESLNTFLSDHLMNVFDGDVTFDADAMFAKFKAIREAWNVLLSNEKLPAQSERTDFENVISFMEQLEKSRDDVKTQLSEWVKLFSANESLEILSKKASDLTISNASMLDLQLEKGIKLQELAIKLTSEGLAKELEPEIKLFGAINPLLKEAASLLKVLETEDDVWLSLQAEVTSWLTKIDNQKLTHSQYASQIAFYARPVKEKAAVLELRHIAKQVDIFIAVPTDKRKDIEKLIEQLNELKQYKPLPEGKTTDVDRLIKQLEKAELVLVFNEKYDSAIKLFNEYTAKSDGDGDEVEQAIRDVKTFHDKFIAESILLTVAEKEVFKNKCIELDGKLLQEDYKQKRIAEKKKKKAQATIAVFNSTRQEITENVEKWRTSLSSGGCGCPSPRFFTRSNRKAKARVDMLFEREKQETHQQFKPDTDFSVFRGEVAAIIDGLQNEYKAISGLKETDKVEAFNSLSEEVKEAESLPEIREKVSATRKTLSHSRTYQVMFWNSRRGSMLTSLDAHLAQFEEVIDGKDLDVPSHTIKVIPNRSA